MDMDDFGLFEGISEVIVTTVSRNGQPNGAPIGIIRRSGKLSARIFNESRTCINVRDTGLLAANVVDDPVLFVQSALGELDSGMFRFIEAKGGMDFPVLASSSAWVLFEAEYKQGSQAITAQLHPIAGDIKHPAIRSVNRGFNAVIEATIHATRYIVFKDEVHLNRIESHKNIINKCGGSREKEAYQLIFRLL